MTCGGGQLHCVLKELYTKICSGGKLYAIESITIRDFIK